MGTVICKFLKIKNKRLTFVIKDIGISLREKSSKPTSKPWYGMERNSTVLSSRMGMR
jgi:hypothetical protein